MTAVLAWLLALSIGGLLYSLVDRPRSLAALPALSGHAVVLGLLACAAIIRVPAYLGMHAITAWTWLWPVAALIVLVPLALRAWRAAPCAGPPGVPSVPGVPDPGPAWAKWLLAFFALLIAVRLLSFYEEAWLRPLFGWDAWLAWSVKAKAWMLSGEAVPFVDASTWWSQPAASTRTSLAPHYPELLSWLQVWLSSPAGTWDERLVNLAWPTLWLALLAGCYGQWRMLGATPLLAAGGAYLLGSLPLANVHAALPGYADLWVGTLIAFAGLALVRWREERNRRHLWLALSLVALLPAIKLEGTVWAIALLALVAWYLLERQSRSARLAAVATCIALLLLLSWLLDLAWFALLAELVASGRQGVGTLDVLASTAQGLFTQGNWQLLWYVVPVVILWRRDAFARAPGMAGLGLFLAVAFSLLLLLFVGTTAGRWAESFTAVNRLVLHLAPLAVSLMVLLLRGTPGLELARSDVPDGSELPVQRVDAGSRAVDQEARLEARSTLPP